MEDVPYADFLERNIFKPISEGSFKGVISVVSLLEILVKPISDGREEAVEDYLASLQNYPNLIIVGVDLPLAVRAARLRVKYRLRTPDAIIAATALETGADGIVTNDRRFSPLSSEIRVLILNELLGYP